MTVSLCFCLLPRILGIRLFHLYHFLSQHLAEKDCECLHSLKSWGAGVGAGIEDFTELPWEAGVSLESGTGQMMHVGAAS